MLKQFALVSAVIVVIGSLAVPVHAKETASVTIALSVFIEPSVYETPQITQNRESLTCEELLGSGANRQAENCQDGTTRYTWQRQSQDELILTITPI